MNRLLQSFVSYDATGHPQQQPPRSSGTAPHAQGHPSGQPNYGHPPPSLPANDDQYETLDLDSIGSGHQQHHAQHQYPISGPRSGSRGVAFVRQHDNGPFSAQYGQQQYASSPDSYFDQSGPHHQTAFTPQSSPPHHPSGSYHTYDHTPQASPPSYPPEANSFFSQDVHHAPAPLSSSSSSASHSFFTDPAAPSSASDLFGSSDPADDFLSAAPASNAPQHSPSYAQPPPSPAFHYDEAPNVADAADLFGASTASSDAFYTPIAHDTAPPAPLADSPVEFPPSAADLFRSPQRPAVGALAKTPASPLRSPGRNTTESVQAAFATMQLNPLHTNPPSPPKKHAKDKPAPASPVARPVTPLVSHANPPSSPTRQITHHDTARLPISLAPSSPSKQPPHGPAPASPPALKVKRFDDLPPQVHTAHSTPSLTSPPTSTSSDHTKQLMLQYKQMAERLESEKNELLDILAAQADQFYAMQAYIDQLVAEKAALAP